MNTSENNVHNYPPKDPIDKLIFEKGLRITTILPVKSLDLLIIVLNTGSIIKSSISEYKLLKNANQEQLEKWELKHNGIAIRWNELDEDLSLRGFITNNLISKMLQNKLHSEINLIEVE